jgi:hypothetical protein
VFLSNAISFLNALSNVGVGSGTLRTFIATSPKKAFLDFWFFYIYFYQRKHSINMVIKYKTNPIKEDYTIGSQV